MQARANIIAKIHPNTQRQPLYLCQVSLQQSHIIPLEQNYPAILSYTLPGEVEQGHFTDLQLRIYE
jgi:hypothetical protein